MSDRVGLGGGCHWCTEAVFQAVGGVLRVEQGWIAPAGDSGRESEAVIAHFDPARVSLARLIDVHLHTHASTSQHRLRNKYRSAIYVVSDAQAQAAAQGLRDAQGLFDQPVITQVLHLGRFRPSPERYRNYYASRPQAPFCQRYIAPKLRAVNQRCRTQ
ncbi:peptide-methionine (S)-S-oxide reductase [Abyssibacter sp.]|uniref:peptide-methionine (S)-S-oxide reductase n=1 Tax=Abyssibacter sp. TaxID=2320200 RepID=UPI0035185A5D